MITPRNSKVRLTSVFTVPGHVEANITYTLTKNTWKIHIDAKSPDVRTRKTMQLSLPGLARLTLI